MKSASLPASKELPALRERPIEKELKQCVSSVLMEAQALKRKPKVPTFLAPAQS